MSAAHPLALELAQLLEPGFRELRTEVAKLRAEVERLKVPPPVAFAPRLHSVREAARLLGVSASKTLAPAIRAGHVRAVRMPGTRRSTRIPADEVERIGREGLGGVRGLRVVRAPRAAPRADALAAEVGAFADSLDAA